MAALYNSKWAPPIPRTRQQDTRSLPTVQRHAVVSREEFDRFSKLLLRIRWKAHHLLTSQQQVLVHNDSAIKVSWSFTDTQSEAETMFKVDFFEFYILLERAIVHLLGVFAVVVSGSTSFEVGDENESDTPNGTYSLLGDQHSFNRATHSFHHNVLQALDSQSNPLHEVLGTGAVREYLSIAKDFRNRWKDAEEQTTTSSSGDSSVAKQRRYERLLRELKLADMLTCILLALTNAQRIAEAECVKLQLATPGWSENATRRPSEDMPWESMPDAMDWD